MEALTWGTGDREAQNEVGAKVCGGEGGGDD